MLHDVFDFSLFVALWLEFNFTLSYSLIVFEYVFVWNFRLLGVSYFLACEAITLALMI